MSDTQRNDRTADGGNGLESVVQRRRHEALFGHPNLTVAVLDPDGLVERFDGSAGSTGASPEAAIGRPFTETQFARRLSIPTEEVRTLLGKVRDGETIEREVRYDGDAATRYFDVTLVPVTDGDGDLESLLLTAYDVTDRAEHELELERRNEQLREFETLVETSPDGTFKLDADARMRYVNTRWAETVDYEVSELEGKPFYELVEESVIPHEVIEEYVDLLQKLLSDSTDLEEGKLETEVVPPNDDEPHIYEARISVLPYEETFDGCAVVVRDVTASRRRERQFSELRNRMTHVLDGNSSLLWSFDLVTDELEEIHGPVEELHRVERDELTDITAALDSIHPDDREAVIEVYESVAKGRTDRASVTYRTHPDNGETNWIRTSAYAQRGEDGSGSSPRLLGLSTDHTETKARQLELERQNERLEEFASVVSHDLRSPLAIADARLEMAREEPGGGHLDHVERSLGRMDDLIGDLLTLAREGESVTETEAVEFAETIDRCWERVETANATLRTDLEGGVEADRTRLGQLFENLIRNAVEHAGDDVTITVGELDGEAGFYFEDDGPGIAPEERDRAFEAGYSTRDGGTGFGLSIVRDVAEAHGWETRLTEGVDGGARIGVTGVAFRE